MPEYALVKDAMTQSVHTMTPAHSIQDAREVFESRRIRHLPIVDDNGVFLGLVTQRDILKADISSLTDIENNVQALVDSQTSVAEIMINSVKTVTGDTPLREAATLLLEHKYGCLPVLDGDRVAGIITEADFIRIALDCCL